MNWKSIGRGLLIGALLTAALLGVMFAADGLAGLPLLPFDLFAWLTRVLPGPVVTFGIDSMVDTLIMLGFDVSETAKTAEHILSVIMVLGIGTVLGGVLYAVLDRRDDAQAQNIGLIGGVVLGLLGAVLHQVTGFGGFDLIGALWLVGLLAAWGAALGWAYEEIAARTASAEGADMTVEQTSRRQFLIRMGGAAAAITVVGAGVALSTGRRRETVSEETSTSAPADPQNVPSADLPDVEYVDADPVPGTRSVLTPVDDHYLIDINPRPPELEEDSWRLSISGLVDSEVELTLDDIRNNYEPVSRYITLSCISNRLGGDLIGTTLWTGARLQDILDDVGLQNRATHIEIRSVDGFHESLDLSLLEADPRIMLAYAWDNQPLTHAHGFPLRIWIPDRFGMKQPRWITEMEVIAEERPGYWVTRGWSEDAIVRTTSVIDTVEDPISGEGDAMVVPVGGIAYAGARGISKVEVQVDDGPWQEAELLEPLSDVTWVLWRYEWPFEEGQHRFHVRCVDGTGEMQITAVTDPRPDGATGIHNVRESL